MTTTPTTKPLPKLVRRAPGRYATEDGRFSVTKNERTDRYRGYIIFDTSKKDEHGFAHIITHCASTLDSAKRKINTYLKYGWC